MKLTKLLVCMAFGAVAAVAFGFSGGDGSEATPYLISTQADLDNVDNDLAAHYELANDIDLGGAAYVNSVIASAASFTGTFDGAGFAISNLTITKMADFVGLFGQVDGGTIEKLRVENLDIVTGDNIGVGLLVASTDGATISQCYTTGSVDAGNFGMLVGGLVGYAKDSDISDCWSSADVEGFQVGGLLGSADGSDVARCYAVGAVGATGGGDAGGLFGENSGSTIDDCYYDTTTTTLAKAVGIGVEAGTGLATAAMQTAVPFANWDNGAWQFAAGVYPALLFAPVDPADMVKVPDLSDMSIKMAVAALEKVGLKAGFVAQVVSVASPGSVVAQLPLADADAVLGSSVDIDVAADATLVFVPNVVGMMREAAITALAADSFTATVERVFDAAPAGTVIAQNANAGSSLPSGFGIVLTVSMGAKGNAGDGSDDNPIRITNAIDWANVANNPDLSYILVSDIVVVTPLTAAVTGTIQSPMDERYEVTFNYADATVDYVAPLPILSEGGLVKGIDFVVNVTGRNSIGGIVAFLYGGTVENCSVTGAVIGNNVVGGIAAENRGTIKNSYSTADLTATAGNVGGIAGTNVSIIEKTYFAATITATSNVGGIAGYNLGSISYSVYDNQVAAVAVAGSNLGKIRKSSGATTVDMQDEATYTSWNFATTWKSVAADYPVLR